ncbi:MAG: hypothetical protein ABI212_14555 [Burkholderiaceae bacterium]
MPFAALTSVSAPVIAMLESASVWRADRLCAQARQDEAPVLPSGHTLLDAQLPGGGWPVGALIELLQAEGAARFDWQLLAPALARLLARHNGPLALVGGPPLPAFDGADRAGEDAERQQAREGARRQQSARSRLVDAARLASPIHPAALEPFGPALIARGVPAARLLWVRCEAVAARLWAAEQALRCAPVAAVLAWLPARVHTAALRRLQFAAQAGGKPCFVFRPDTARQEASPAPLRLLLGSAGDAIEIDVFKRRGPPAARPLRLAARSAPLTALLGAMRVSARADAPAQPAAEPMPPRQKKVFALLHGCA